MSITATSNEYAQFRGTPLDTAAWRCVDYSSLWDSPETRGGDVTIPYAPGVLPGRRVYEARRVILPLVVFGDYAPTGTKHADPRAGLRSNLDELARLTRPGIGNLRFHTPSGTVRAAPAQVVGSLQVAAQGPVSATVVIDLQIHGGVFRSESATTATLATGSGTRTLTVSNPGTAEQWVSTLTLSGTATTTTITNTTYPGDPRLTVAVDLSAGNVVINTGNYTAVQGSNSVTGSLTPVGHPNWMPLVPGNNSLTVTANAGLVVSHFAPFA
jgi:hypothetical protein